MFVRPLSFWTVAASFFITLFVVVQISYAWTGPTASPPSSNVGAPINVGSTNQTKNANIGVNGLAVFGNSLLQASSYLNWGVTAGLTGYGIRDNAGTIEFKNSGGTGGTSGWKSLGTIINEYIALGGSWSAGTGSSIYYNLGNVGVGVASPTNRFGVRRAAGASATADFRTDDGTQWIQVNSNSTAGGWNPLAQAGDHTLIYSNGTVESGALLIGPWSASNKGIRIDAAGDVGVGLASYSDSKFRVAAAGTTQHGIVAFGPSTGSSYYGVYGASGSYNAGLGRADGYSFVGSGIAYNNGAVQATSFLYLSDARMKKNVTSLDTGLVTLMKLRPVSFTWKEDATGMEGMIDSRAGKNDIGFIAQEVEKIMPGIVTTNPKGLKAVDYIKLVPVLVKAVQEQQAEIDSLSARLEKLEKNN